MQIETLIALLRNLAPEAWQEKWDNSGLLVASSNKEIRRILVTVDVTNAVIDHAIEKGCELIISHHPLIFSGLKRVTQEDPIGKRVLKLIEHGISLYAMHTNFDASDRGMSMAAAKRLGLNEVSYLGEQHEDISEDGYEVTIGIGAQGRLSEPMSLRSFCAYLKQQFAMDGLRVFRGEADWEKPISKVAFCPGSGRDYIQEAMRNRADVYVTGDIGHHVGLDTAEEGLVVIDCGHYQMEWIFIPVVAAYLQELCGQEVEIIEDAYRPSYESV